MVEKRRSLFFPVLLVGVGIFLLLNNLGIIEGSFNEILRVYWPAILILGGLDALYRRDGWVWPMVLIGLGTILLLGNLNYLPASALPLLAKIWPILLVAIGLDIAFSGKNSGWYAFLRVGMGLLLVGLILWLAVSTSTSANLVKEDFEQARDGAKSSQIDFSIVAGRLKLEPTADPDKLITGSVHLLEGLSFETDYTAPKNGESNLRIDVANQGIIMDTSSMLFDFAVNPDIPLTINADVTVGEMDFNLAESAVTAVNTEMAVGRQVMRLPCERDTVASLDLAVGDMDVYIPQGCDVTINLDNGLAYASLPPGYQRDGDVVINPAAGSGTGSIQLTVDLALGRVGIHEE